jgi:nucleoside-diphosphate-sugar epimerase
MKVLITGGAGFIGYHLAKFLSAKGAQVVIADNLSRGKKDEELEALFAGGKVSLIEVDLTDRGAWAKLGTGYDRVYHLASINGTKLFYEKPDEVLRVGLLSALHALDWFEKDNGVKDAKILYTSSNEAYAGALEAFHQLPIPTPEDVPLVIEDPYNPRWSYAGQKLAGELLFINFAKVKGFRMSIVRPHNFYGPRAGYGHVIPETVAKIAKKTEPFPLFGAEETRSFCYITDAVEAMEAVMESKKTDGGTYHIGSTVETKIGELIEEIFTICDWHPKTTDAKASPAGSVARRLPDVSKIKRDTGWEATTPLHDGLKKTAEWYLAHPALDA